MVTNKKRSGCCWTCRLRHKKCDKLRPECGECKSLEIDCHFNPHRPEWMTRGPKQREMAENIKQQIKQNAAVRREKNQISESATNGDTGKGAFVIHFESNLSKPPSGSGNMDSNTVSVCGSSSPMATSAQGPYIHSTIIGDSLQIRSPDHIPEDALDFKHHLMDSMCLASRSQNLDFEIDFIMKYLDYVFPCLFPFYRPAIFESGRGWLLSLLRNSRIAFHSTLGLTSYFFTIALTDNYGELYADCNSELWKRLENQSDMCFEVIQTNMKDFNLCNNATTTLEKVHVMESIIQILIFEVVLGKSADWDMHLMPAIALLEEVINGANSHNSKLISILRSIGVPSWYKAEFDHYIWNPDQAGFRFFAALLIFIDIIANTALAKPPRLTQYHCMLLSNEDNGAPIIGFNYLRLSTLIGCQNSVIVAIGQIATLDAWKQSMKRAGKLSMLELVERSSSISESLKALLNIFNSNTAVQSPQDSLNLPFQSYAVRSSAPSPSMTTTRIWTYAAQIYLAVVVSGWRISKPEIREGISCTLKLLQFIPSNQLRTLAWPLCVAGCLASVDQEQSFRDIFTTKKKVELIGSLNEAKRVMEKVWESRAEVDIESWDLAACLNILEKPVLLI